VPDQEGKRDPCRDRADRGARKQTGSSLRPDPDTAKRILRPGNRPVRLRADLRTFVGAALIWIRSGAVRRNIFRQSPKGRIRLRLILAVGKCAAFAERPAGRLIDQVNTLAERAQDGFIDMRAAWRIVDRVLHEVAGGLAAEERGFHGRQTPQAPPAR
jgi:hypothetical protein